ncbi:MAG: hypothetical protein IT244_11615, partial [Bacteroidia bacterium]|nr:hypothetical protein [Bacteroidia bacterium]
MKKTYFLVLASTIFTVFHLSAQTVKLDSTVMGSQYANQIFYDMKNGQVGSASIANWDIAHTSDIRDNCIRVNHINGIRVIHYKPNTSWESFDTAGWKTWGMNYNDIHNHEKGAMT